MQSGSLDSAQAGVMGLGLTACTRVIAVVTTAEGGVAEGDLERREVPRELAGREASKGGARVPDRVQGAECPRPVADAAAMEEPRGWSS